MRDARCDFERAVFHRAQLLALHSIAREAAHWARDQRQTLVPLVTLRPMRTFIKKILLPITIGLLPMFVAAQAVEPSPVTTPSAEPAVVGQPKALPKVVLLRPSGSYADLSETIFSPLALLTGGGGSTKPFYTFLESVEVLAKAEGAVLFFDLSGDFAFNLPQLAELERAIGKVRSAGKKIVCYLENADSGCLQIAALCDRVLMADLGACDFRSASMNVMHYKDALDLLGVQMEMTRVGDFKGAVEPFVLAEMSQHLRQHYEAMLQSMNDDVVRRVAAGRKLTKEKVRELQKKRLLRASEAKEAGLVDALVPWEGGKRALQKELSLADLELVDGQPKKKQKKGDLLSMFTGLLSARREVDESEGEELVVFHLSGSIADGESGAGIVSGPAVKAIDALAANQDVKGVVVRINSPGGSATASEAIRRALERLAAQKPVVISMGELAASGGYWVTCIGRPIIVESGTITGSIGVFSTRMQVGALMRRIGVHSEIVALDEGPLMDAMDRPWTEAARSTMQGIVDDIYDRFIGLVATSRHMAPETVRGIAGGRVWSGTQAKDLGLCDAIGGLNEALVMVRKEAKVADDIEVRHAPKARDLASSLAETLFDAKVTSLLDPKLQLLRASLGRLAGLRFLLDGYISGTAGAKVYALVSSDISVR